MNNKISLILKNDFNEFSKLSRFLEKYGRQNSIGTKVIFQLNLSLEEIFNNILLYGYKDQMDHDISFNFNREDKRITIEIVDDAAPFNPLNIAKPNLTSPLDKRVPGGLGIHFVRNLMDDVKYKRRKKKNILTMVKELSNKNKMGEQNGD